MASVFAKGLGNIGRFMDDGDWHCAQAYGKLNVGVRPVECLGRKGWCILCEYFW